MPSSPSRLRTLVRLLCLIAALAARGASAQGITIQSPTAGQTLPAGPDYATDVLGDPWDMSNREDYSPFEPGEVSGFSSIGLDGQGRLVAVPSIPDAGIGLLYAGFLGAVNPGRNGRTFPIDTAKYGKMSYKVTSSVAGEIPQIYWRHHPHGHPDELTTYGGRLGDSIVAGTQILVYTLAGTPHDGNAVTGTWTAGSVAGIRLDPNGTAASVGQTFAIDWVRLVPADGHPSAPHHTVQWTGPAGGYTLTVAELGGNPANAYTVATGVTTGSFEWYYGFLPPGAYRLTVRHQTAGQRTVDFTINQPPVLHVTEPDETGDGDFATTVIGNPWDMSDPADVAEVKHVAGDAGTFSGGQFHATSPANAKGGDSQVFFLRNVDEDAPLINPLRYHRLTFTMTLDGPLDIGSGSVARVFWGSQAGHPELLATTGDIIVFPGARTISFDLDELAVGPDGVEPDSEAVELWRDGTKRFFRIDPHEFQSGRTFHFDDVRIASNDRPTDDAFRITWAATDADANDGPTVTLWYDVDRDATNGRTLIADRVPASAGEYVWDTSALPDGTYWIHTEITDGRDTTARWSTGPVQKGEPQLPESCGNCTDDDGNGLVDDEDPACCAKVGLLSVKRANLTIGRKGPTQGQLQLSTTIGDPSFSNANPTAETTRIQIRNRNGKILCTRLTGWRRGGKKAFKLYAGGKKADGLRDVVLKRKKTGLELNARGGRFDLRRFDDSENRVTLRIGQRCATGGATFRAKPNDKGWLYP